MEKINIPNHVAIIVDGNGRWAKKQGKNRSYGHKKGFERLEEIIKYASSKNIKVLSLYIFSTENFKRSKEEVDYLMNLFEKNLTKFSDECSKENMKIFFSGRKKPLNDKIIKMMSEIEEKTKENTGTIINFCLNYGGRAEIVDAVKKIANNLTLEQINNLDENEFKKYLYHELPDIDFMIRTSGEQRLSNFLLWQNSYAEFYFPEVQFPDFTKEEFDKAILEYQKRNRRFGGIVYENKNN